MSNDRFKFRAWDKENSIMHYNAECAYDSMNGTPPLMHDSFGSLLDDDNFIIEQCTGLKDKNGNLIYEGDVVKTKDFGKDIDNRINVNDYDTFVVKFHEGGFYIENDSRSFPISCRPKLEIIGNIHEMEVCQ